jgi:hypothetical protein
VLNSSNTRAFFSLGVKNFKLELLNNDPINELNIDKSSN